MSTFARYIGIDYSGAQAPTTSLKGLRFYLIEIGAPPTEVPRSPRKCLKSRGCVESVA